MKNIRHFPFPQSQRGMATLLIAMLLLGILTVVTFLALQVGIFEQRTVGAENRQRMVEQVADAGLSQAAEFIKAQTRPLTRDWMSADAATRRWALCDRGDTTWPCGAETSPNRRERLFRYQFGTDNAGTPNLDERLVFVSQTAAGGVTGIGGFTSNYAVGGLLCMVDNTDPINPACATVVDPARGWTGPVAVTLVSRSTIPGESAAGTAKVTVGSFRAINGPPNVPIIASAGIGGLGSGEIVASPNAGGFGVPLSIWANTDVDITTGGTMQSCHLGEFLTNFTASGPRPYDGITVCDTCRCNGLEIDRGLLSGKVTGGGLGSAQYEGIDVLDVDNSTAASPNGSLPDTTYFPFHPLDNPANSLDDSLFEYIFGQENSSEDSSALVDADGNGKDDGRDFMERSAIILNGGSCANLNATSTGLYYVPPGVSCRLGGQIGTPSEPIALVVEGSLDIQASTVIYGMVFVKRGIGTTPIVDVRGGMQLYGALVTEGALEIRGSPQFIYDERVLTNMAFAPGFQRFGVLPGSWSDADSF